MDGVAFGKAVVADDALRGVRLILLRSHGLRSKEMQGLKGRVFADVILKPALRREHLLTAQGKWRRR